ncbi:TRAP transporter TAXI family solute receptor [Natronocella acetinitrilica]|uniref:TRAP transporter TAXI family solute receptor n=1 Tax=Natronocella acetinitrilica TaxID=414046 RepID=A0AAE3GA01_9GAMM|nr:TAXI family TRAP transporter solute-binding subunit [Natronocella acetinitrilica]MCP1677263.1 TRAP transporter TAXI family solute receptor [Natronocella acetinitrilica]
MRVPRLVIAATGIALAVGMTHVDRAYAQGQQMTAYAGSVGGLYMEVMSIWVSDWERDIDGLNVSAVSGGGTTNPFHVSRGDPNGTIGITDSITTADAMQGEGDIGSRAPDGLTNLRALVRLNALSHSAFMIRGSRLPEGVTTVGELLEREPSLRWAFLQRGNPGEMTGRRVLEQYDVSLDDLSAWGGRVSFNPQGEHSSLMIDGHVDVSMVMTRAPAAFMLDIDASVRDLVWLPIDEHIVDQMMEQYGGYIKVDHPAEFYDTLKEPFPTASVDHVLFVHEDMDEELAYGLTKSVLENADRMRSSLTSMSEFDPAVVCRDTGEFELHPGAERACSELGHL